MIKKSIAYIEEIINTVLADTDKGDTPEDNGYYRGCKDIAENVQNGLEGTERLYSIYAPLASTGWEEIAVTSNPEYARVLSLAFCSYQKRGSKTRYEAPDNKVIEVKYNEFFSDVEEKTIEGGL